MPGSWSCANPVFFRLKPPQQDNQQWDKKETNSWGLEWISFYWENFVKGQIVFVNDVLWPGLRGRKKGWDWIGTLDAGCNHSVRWKVEIRWLKKLVLTKLNSVLKQCSYNWQELTPADTGKGLSSMGKALLSLTPLSVFSAVRCFLALGDFYSSCFQSGSVYCLMSHT